jgi:toxin ParE1/3/4
MGRVVRAREAKSDLVEIVLDLRSHSPEAAKRFRTAFEEKCRILADFPLMGREREELGPSLRSIAITPYIVFYRPLDDGIAVARVVHSSRDVTKLFDA